jgi:hypothetical protein
MAANMTTVTMLLGDGQVDQLSDAVRGDGYYGYRDGYHTVAIQFNNFIGRIQLEATLELHPTEADWFPIWLLQSSPFKEYPTAKTGNEAFSFRGNFVLLRFRKIRSYLTDTSSIGDITKVMLSI